MGHTRHNNRGSRVSNVVTKDSQLLGKFGDTSNSFRTAGSDSPVQRHRKKTPRDKPLKSKGFGEAVAELEMGVSEVVRKQGNQWVVFDDHTGVQIGAYKNRKAAWDAQRVRRQQSKFSRGKKKGGANHPKAVRHHISKGQKGKKRVPKAQSAQHGSTAPKIKHVKGIKSIKPIAPLKPIKPKGLKSPGGMSSKQESFEKAVALSLLMETKTK